MKLTIDEALRQGVTAHNSGNLQEAERVYRGILQNNPKHPDTNYYLGLIFISTNQIEAALPLFKTALDVNPMIEQFWVSYIDALVKGGRLKAAKQAIKKAKKNGFDAKKLALLTSPTKLKAATKEPSQTQLNNLMEHFQNGQYGDAEKLALLITREFPKHQFAWKVLGAALAEAGRIQESLPALQKATQLALKDAYAHYNLGITLQGLGRLEEAETSYAQAVTLKPDYADAHSNLGVTLHELNRLEEAKASLRQAIALNPENAEAHSNLGATLKELARLEEAEASYTQALVLKPDFTDALMNRWQLLFDKKEFDAALKDIDLCNTEGSRARSLETLYALGRIDEIYKRIELQASIDDKNLRMAALSAFLSEREKKPTAHKFCQDPLSFLHFSNISSHLEDASAFVTGIIEELNKVATVWEPGGKATVKGFQTLDHINLFAKPSGKMAQLKSMILHELDTYYFKFQNNSCSFIQKWPSEKSLRGWYVVLKKQGFQEAHIHAGGWLSGVIYLKVVPPLKTDEGAIEFSLNSKNYSDVRSPKFLHQPALGDIVFFPSSLHHRTIPFSTETNRIIVSFDLMAP